MRDLRASSLQCARCTEQRIQGEDCTKSREEQLKSQQYPTRTATANPATVIANTRSSPRRRSSPSPPRPRPSPEDIEAGRASCLPFLACSACLCHPPFPQPWTRSLLLVVGLMKKPSLRFARNLQKQAGSANPDQPFCPHLPDDTCDTTPENPQKWLSHALMEPAEREI